MFPSKAIITGAKQNAHSLSQNAICVGSAVLQCARADPFQCFRVSLIDKGSMTC